jgi:hypothetical protein
VALNGLSPIILFQLYKKVQTAAPATQSKIPLVSDIAASVKATYAVIPLYLDEQLTGIMVDTESKNIDIETKPDGLTSGEAGPVNQKPLGSITTVNLIAKRDSVGLTILLALSELLLDKAVSQEFEVTYINGAITVFGGLIHSFSFDQGGNDDLLKLKLEIARGRPKSKSVVVEQDPNATRLASTGSVPPAGAPTVTPSTAGNAGKSVIQPNVSVVKP